MNIKNLTTIALVGVSCLALSACDLRTSKSAPIDYSHNTVVNQPSPVTTAGVGEDYEYFAEEEDIAMAKELGLPENIVYFDFDSSTVKPEFLDVVTANAKYLKSHPNAKILISGHTDPRGSREYNIGLGKRRSDQLAERLSLMGVPRIQIETVSYGQEKLAVVGNDEQAYRLDRRAEISYEVHG